VGGAWSPEFGKNTSSGPLTPVRRIGSGIRQSGGGVSRIDQTDTNCHVLARDNTKKGVNGRIQEKNSRKTKKKSKKEEEQGTDGE
jgi:hypothetical protein